MYKRTLLPTQRNSLKVYYWQVSNNTRDSDCFCEKNNTPLIQNLPLGAAPRIFSVGFLSREMCITCKIHTCRI